MTQTQFQPKGQPHAWDVIEAARRAWEWQGVACHVRPSSGEFAGVVGALNLPDRRQVEVFVADVNEEVWSAVDHWPISQGWVMRAVVPLPTIGQAHEALRDHGCEVQGYWVQDNGKVAFGSVEIA